jgi:hypothetical protein
MPGESQFHCEWIRVADAHAQGEKTNKRGRPRTVPSADVAAAKKRKGPPPMNQSEKPPLSATSEPSQTGESNDLIAELVSLASYPLPCITGLG